MHIFHLVERVMERNHPPRLVREGGILRYEIAPLPARKIVLRGDEVVRRGAACVILHMAVARPSSRHLNPPRQHPTKGGTCRGRGKQDAIGDGWTGRPEHGENGAADERGSRLRQIGRQTP